MTIKHLKKIIKPLDKKEKIAIDNLKKAIDELPPSVWCYLTPSCINIMRYGQVGNIPTTETGSIDPEYKVGVINVSSVRNNANYGHWDGGDW